MGKTIKLSRTSSYFTTFFFFFIACEYEELLIKNKTQNNTWERINCIDPLYW